MLYFRSSTAAYAGTIILSAAASAVSIALAALGFAILARTRPAWAALAAIPIFYFLILTGPIGSPKYCIPMEPALIVLAAVGLVGIVRFGSASDSDQARLRRR